MVLNEGLDPKQTTLEPLSCSSNGSGGERIKCIDYGGHEGHCNDNELGFEDELGFEEQASHECGNKGFLKL